MLEKPGMTRKEAVEYIANNPWHEGFWQARDRISFIEGYLEEYAYALSIAGNNDLAKGMGYMAEHLEITRLMINNATSKAMNQRYEESAANMLSLALGMAVKEAGDIGLAEKIAKSIK